MRETVVALLMLGAVAAVSAVSRERSCVSPPDSSSQEDDGGEKAVFQNVLVRPFTLRHLP